jgi:hypothetical protein
VTNDQSTQSTQDMPAIEHSSEPAPQSPLAAQQAAEGGPNPEVLVGAAFVGGFVAAKLLKRLGGGGD